MSAHAIEFLQEWIGEKIQSPCRHGAIEKEAEALARQCVEQAAEAGIPLEDIQEEVGELQDLMVVKLEEAAETDPAPETAAASEAAAAESKAPAETARQDADPA